MNNQLILACAGAGKTTYIVDKAIQNQNLKTLITTYTNNNEQEIRQKFIDKIGFVPSHVTIMPWWTFLLKDGVRPYCTFNDNIRVSRLLMCQGKSGEIPNTQPKRYYGRKQQQFYLSIKNNIYSDKIADYFFHSNKIDNRVISRLEKIYDCIYMDEVQDLVGYDLEIIKLLFESNIQTILVGDERQHTITTHWEKKNKKYNGKVKEFLQENIKTSITWNLDETKLQDSYRCNQNICDVANQVFDGEYSAMKSAHDIEDTHKGVFLVHKKDVDEYLNEYNPMQLRYDRRTKVNEDYSVINMGKSKGLSYNRTLIYPTDKMKKWLRREEFKNHLLYVAITRSRHSVAFVYDYNEKEKYREGIQLYNPSAVF